MSNDDDKMIDEDGVVYEKGLWGQYHPKQGFWGPEEDKDGFGNPNIERDFFNNPIEDKDFFGNSTQSFDGKTLYKPTSKGSSSSSSSSSSSGGGGSSGEFDLAVGLAILTVSVVFPIIASIIVIVVALGVPVAIFWVVFIYFINYLNLNIVLATTLGTTLSLAFCFIDIILIRRFYSDLSTNWQGKVVIAYLCVLLTVPWLTGVLLVSYLEIDQQTYPINSFPSGSETLTPISTSEINSTCPTWKTIRRDLSGNRFEIWTLYIKDQPNALEWIEFKDLSLTCNPILVEDGFEFIKGKEYLLP